MRTTIRRTAEVLAIASGAIVVLRPGTRANRAARHQAEAVGRQLRYFAGRLHGVSYRLRGRHPDPDVSGNELADRIRSSLGPLEKRLDLPHIHVMVEGQIALLHGQVNHLAEADEIEAAVEAVPGVLGVESYLHIGLGRGDTRPSTGRAVAQPSEARRRLFAAATSAGVDSTGEPSIVGAILATFAERIPQDEREHVATHLPADVRSMFTPPRRLRRLAPVRTVPDLVARIAADTEVLPNDKAVEVTRAVISELRALVPDEVADVAATLPRELRDLWNQ
ncbi:MAG: DUF2267 domain-containing protein [Ilumatobacteraceae bacterium]